MGQLSDEELDVVRAALAGPRQAPGPSADDAAEALAALVLLDRADAAEGEGEAALLRAVIADRDAEGPKRIYADWLLERGDPYGEFVALSLQPEPDEDVQRRIAALRPVARQRWAALPGEVTFVGGLPDEVTCADRDGNRHGAYGEDAAWGLVRAADVVPASDTAHTESLRTLAVGSSFVGDLVRLERPLAVRHLVLTSFSRSTGRAWKKVAVLPEVRHVSMPATHDPDAVSWFLGDTAIGRQVTRLDVRALPAMLSAASGWLDAQPALQEVRFGAFARATRTDAGPRLHLDLEGRGAPDEVRALLRGITAPVADTLTVRWSSPDVEHDALRVLGRPLRDLAARDVVVEGGVPSGVAARAQVVRQGGLLQVWTHGDDVLDESSLGALLAGEAPPAHFDAQGSVDLRTVGALWRATRDAGVGMLTVRRQHSEREVESPVATRWFRGPMALTLRDDVGEVLLGTFGATEPLGHALRSLGHLARVTVSLAPGIPDEKDAAVAALAAEYADEVVLVREPVHTWLVAHLVRSPGRLELSARIPGASLGEVGPDAVDAMIAQQPKPEAVKAVQLEARAAAMDQWVAWVAAGGRKVVLASRMARYELSRTAAGVALQMDLVHRPAEDLAVLAPLADGALASLKLRPRGPVPPEVSAEAARVARTVSVGR
ncbi:MAG: TIGR02996 domain-containing protein [Myxococcota bacterium]